jgi:hypothetical protein
MSLSTDLSEVTDDDINESGQYTVPEGVTSISKAAFYRRRKLVSITIPTSVLSIEDMAFYGCSKLASIIIPESVMSVGHDAFSGCSNLVRIIIPKSVTSIGSEAFWGCNPSLCIICEDDDYSRVRRLLPKELWSRVLCPSSLTVQENLLSRLQKQPLLSTLRSSKLPYDIRQQISEHRGGAFTPEYYRIEAKVRGILLPDSKESLDNYKARAEKLFDKRIKSVKKSACIRSLEEYVVIVEKNIPEKYREPQFFSSLRDDNKRIINRLNTVKEFISRLKRNKLTLSEDEVKLFNGQVLAILKKYEIPYNVVRQFSEKMSP